MTSTELICAPTDLPVIVADYLADTDLMQQSLLALGKFFIAIPVKLAAWLGPELRTPDNSQPPRFIPSESGPWNGVVFVEQDDVRYWVLAKAQSRPRQQPATQGPDRYSPQHDERYGWPPEQYRGHYYPEEDQEPEYFARPWEQGPWGSR